MCTQKKKNSLQHCDEISRESCLLNSTHGVHQETKHYTRCKIHFFELTAAVHVPIPHQSVRRHRQTSTDTLATEVSDARDVSCLQNLYLAVPTPGRITAPERIRMFFAGSLGTYQHTPVHPANSGLWKVKRPTTHRVFRTRK